MSNARDSGKSTVAIVSGAALGANLFATVGRIGLIGSFGGMSLGMGMMTGVGAIAGAAAFGGWEALKTGDATALGAIGMGALGGAGASATIGGMGLSVGGTAVGIGMGTMAVAGGVFGLGIYGLHKAFVGSDRQAKFYKNWVALEAICRDFEDEQGWLSLEIESELKILQQKIMRVSDFQGSNFGEIERESSESESIMARQTYSEGVCEVDPVLSAVQWERRLADLEIEEELDALRRQSNKSGNH